MKQIVLALLILFSLPTFAQRLTVKVINRQDSDRTYSYLVANRNGALGQTLDL
jgi:hypothetical protein